MAAVKALFLGVRKLHSNKKNQDYRTVEFYVPPFKDGKGFERGGVMTYFTELDSTVGSDLRCGAIVIPEITYDAMSRREELVGFKVVKATPYNMAVDFNN